MITVQNLLEYSIEQEYSMLAHTIFWAISSQNINPNDDSSVLKNIEFDQVAITNLMQQNVLGLGNIKLFVITVAKDIYAFYFAKTSFEALVHHSYLFAKKANQIVEAKRLMHTKMFWPDTDQEMKLIEYRKQLLDFPAYVGHARAGEHILYKLQRGVSKVV